jgi:hypothetical protein
MATFLKMAAAALLAVGFAGCASAPAGSGPCASCVDGVTTVKKTPERHSFCVVNGKQVDCTKNPAECPNCAKAK